MNPIPDPKYNFSSNALRAIESLRPEFEAMSREKSGAVVVAWGTSIPHDGSPGRSAVVISFYTESQMVEMGQHVVKIDGMDVINFLLPQDFPRFDGKIIDYADNRGFFLR
jgi:hypothetical protein